MGFGNGKTVADLSNRRRHLNTSPPGLGNSQTSSPNHQLRRVQQQKLGWPFCLSISIVADHEDSLGTIDNGAANALGALEIRHAGNRDAAR